MVRISNNKTVKLSSLQYVAIVVGVPVLVMVVLFFLLFKWSDGWELAKTDEVLLYLSPMIIALGVYWKWKRYWFRQKDGSYLRIPKSYFKHPTQEPKSAFQEPTEYDIIAFYSITFSLFSCIAGIGLILFSVVVWNDGFVILPIVFLLFGLLLSINGAKNLVNRQAQLKLSENGIWTSKLGFRNKAEIRELKVFTKRRYKSPEWILEIYLKHSSKVQPLTPDDSISLSSLQGCEEMVEYLQRVKL